MIYQYFVLLPADKSISDFQEYVLKQQQVELLLDGVYNGGFVFYVESATDRVDLRDLAMAGFKVRLHTPEVVAVATELTIEDYKPMIRTALHDKAVEYGYDSIVTAASYATSTIPKFAREGKAFSEWRDLCWSTVFALTDFTIPPEEVLSTAPRFEDILQKY